MPAPSTNSFSKYPEPAKPRVLAVDDQRDSLRLLQLRLQTAGLECVTFTDANEALAWLEHNTPDVIILDVMMPQMDGFELCRRIKLDERLRDVPVLFLTARMDTEDKVRGLEVGGHDYLSKPVEQQELLARTRAALRVKQLQDQLKEQLHLQQEVNQLQQQMLGEHWEKTLGQLAASLAHEINNPLAVALGTVELLELEDSFPAEIRQRFATISESLQRAGRKLRSLLLIAQTVQQPQTVQLDQLIDDVTALANYQLVIHRIQLTTDLQPDCLWSGDPSELARAALYLLNNAIEAVAGTPDPRIEVCLQSQHPETCDIRITDNGPGIPEDLRQRIFEPFFTTKGQPHHGVGLYVAEKLIRDTGGRIAFDCPPSGGTTFILTLPRTCAKR